jgi:hypothetical protein
MASGMVDAIDHGGGIASSTTTLPSFFIRMHSYFPINMALLLGIDTRGFTLH